ncbi:MAG: hypothetical protein WC846_00495 [Candidatus Gracilibacteria bacterium]|jgi:hypothetical protein
MRGNKVRKPLSQEVYATYRLLTATVFLLCIIFTGAYLYTNTLKPAKGYQLEKLQSEYESLQSDLRKVDQKITEAQSFKSLENNNIVEDMEKSEDQVSFLEDSTYAQNTQNGQNAGLGTGRLTD